MTLYRPGYGRVWIKPAESGRLVPTTPDDGLPNIPRDDRKAVRRALPDGTEHIQFVDLAGRQPRTVAAPMVPEEATPAPPAPTRRERRPAPSGEDAPLGLRLKTPDPWR